MKEVTKAGRQEASLVASCLVALPDPLRNTGFPPGRATVCARCLETLSQKEEPSPHQALIPTLSPLISPLPSAEARMRVSGPAPQAAHLRFQSLSARVRPCTLLIQTGALSCVQARFSHLDCVTAETGSRCLRAILTSHSDPLKCPGGLRWTLASQFPFRELRTNCFPPLLPSPGV